MIHGHQEGFVKVRIRNRTRYQWTARRWASGVTRRIHGNSWNAIQATAKAGRRMLVLQAMWVVNAGCSMTAGSASRMRGGSSVQEATIRDKGGVGGDRIWHFPSTGSGSTVHCTPSHHIRTTIIQQNSSEHKSIHQNPSEPFRPIRNP